MKEALSVTPAPAAVVRGGAPDAPRGEAGKGLNPWSPASADAPGSQ